MPTPDASAFTTRQKYNAIGQRLGNAKNIGIKPFTNLYQYVPRTSGLPDFLPSFTNKVVTPLIYNRINTSMSPTKTVFGYYRSPYIR